MTNTDTAEIVSGELVPTETRTLFRVTDPVEVLDEAARVAGALKGAIDAGGMVQKIGRNEHVRVEGWQTLGSMLGIAPYVVWTRKIEDGWEARAEARTVDGRVVSAAEAMVTTRERNWKDAEEYAVRSMAQTRAISKALRGPLSFVVTLAGYSGTPAEEMSGVPAEVAPELPAWAQDIGDVNPVATELGALLDAAGVRESGIHKNQIGNKILDTCGDQFPRIAADTIHLIASAITASPMKERDEPDNHS